MSITSINELISLLKKKDSYNHLRKQFKCRIRHGHFYRVVIIRELNVVVKFLKSKDERCRYAQDKNDSLFTCSGLKTGAQKFPRVGSKLGRHFLYPIWMNSCRSIIVQDLVDTSFPSSNIAYLYFHGKDFDMIEGTDIHEGNVGLFDGVPVIIDYWHK